MDFSDLELLDEDVPVGAQQAYLIHHELGAAPSGLLRCLPKAPQLPNRRDPFHGSPILEGSRELETTYGQAYTPAYSLPNWPCMGYPSYSTSKVISPAIIRY